MYTRIKKVRQNNGQKFIDCFKRLYTIGVYSKSGDFYVVKKSHVWENAESSKIEYYLTDLIYANRRIVMVIV